MKKTLIACLMALCALAAAAEPILIGHRGSGWGLENSEESFKKGVELGYKYLETDVKFTKDLHLVCSHDDDTKRLGGTKTLATSTLEELKSETLSQTRNGVKYTGVICSMAEYLQICKEGGIGALIELKWTTGINSNDCSRIPLLIQGIEEAGMRNNVIILTSMKPCLEYIRTNYPDIPLQFLTGEYWSSHFDWCVQWNIDVDIQSGYFDKSCVTKFHDKGLKVNVWTANNDAAYKTYGNMGCDYITTDYLDAANLPELTPPAALTPNTADYPESTFSPVIRSNYDVDDETVAPWPSALEGKTVRRAVRGAGLWYVLAADAAGSPSLYAIPDAEDAREMSLAGIEGGETTLADIALSADGKLVGCNIEIVTNDDSTTKPFKVYIWDNADATPSLLMSTSLFSECGNFISARVGTAFAVSGHSNDLKIYTVAYSTSASSPTYRVCGYHVDRGTMDTAVYALDANEYTAANWGKFSFVVTPNSRNNILVSSSNCPSREYTFNWDGTRIPMDKYSEGTAATGPASFMRYGAKNYAIVSASDGTALSVADLTDGLENMATVTAPFGSFAATDYVATGMTPGADGTSRLHALVAGQGISSWRFDSKAAANAGTPEDLVLVLERQWILSTTTDNAPEHIDGTNAQQGVAVDGLFYVNDCADAKIYIFDNTGCIGSIPGGKGWGCCRDDAGNIIVRDDKLVETAHSFLIYPAGARPDDYEEAVRVEVEVPVEGQTNFINASGDLLGDGGYIYLYPNKQSKINIIALADGKVTGYKTSGDVQFTGTTAGYVVPVDNNSENWLYQVRANGIAEYSGGANTEVLTGRSTTSAPNRNSTGGFALITEGANRILVYNSGANYLGGFSVRDLTLDTVIDNVEPIGNIGYTTGGNYSTFNWLFAERRAKADYIIYQYTPANGMAVYRLYNPANDGVEVVDAATDGIVVRGRTISCADAASFTVYNLAGQAVAEAEGPTATLKLPAGVYVVRSNNGHACKVALK
ncbi:MAG: hypothetical protein K2M55_07495 [Muribaculaceae bacterium]|nr:hypothetical protein [Muribaculaceae bacterium]